MSNIDEKILETRLDIASNIIKLSPAIPVEKLKKEVDNYMKVAAGLFINSSRKLMGPQKSSCNRPKKRL